MPPSPPLIISDIHILPQKDATAIIERITRLEKRTFPPSEAFEFSLDLWKKKPNTRVIYAKSAELASPSDPSPPRPLQAGKKRGVAGITTTNVGATNNTSSNVIAYAVYARAKGIALLHKICVAEPYRGSGVGEQLMAYIEQRLRREGCQCVLLWVDKERAAARKLYTRRGFEEMEAVENYYGNGRTGVKMVLELGR